MQLLQQLGLSVFYALFNKQHTQVRKMHPLLRTLVGFSYAMPVIILIILLINVLGQKYGHLLKPPEDDTELKED